MTTPDLTAYERRVQAQSSYMDFIEHTADENPIEAATMMWEGLMRGNKEELRLGYGIGSALIATLESLERWGHPLSHTEIGVLIERVAVPKEGVVEYGPSSRG